MSDYNLIKEVLASSSCEIIVICLFYYYSQCMVVTSYEVIRIRWEENLKME